MRATAKSVKRKWTILIIAATVTLGGCLNSEEKAEVSAVPETPGTNRAPTISGNPAGAIRIGNTYSFIPNASDPDGDQLTFSVSNQPSWASFDTKTGALTGSPTLGDVGTFTGVTITVSDGQATSSLSAYSIEVTQVSLGSVTLSWTAPTQNSDGSTLTDLSAYKIYYGTTPGNYPTTIRIDNPSITTYVVENLTPATYYFVSTALNRNNVESSFSNEAIKVVN